MSDILYHTYLNSNYNVMFFIQNSIQLPELLENHNAIFHIVTNIVTRSWTPSGPAATSPEAILIAASSISSSATSSSSL
jgi:hypothetical protein